MKYFNMSQKEVDTYETINRCIRKELTTEDTANLTGLSVRHIYQPKADVKEKGVEALVHRNREKESNKKIPEEKKERIAGIIWEKYHDFWPEHAREKSEDHGIYYSSEALRQIMIENDLWKPKERKTSEYRAKQPPKEHFGEMALLDGSYHDWFEGRDGTREKMLSPSLLG